MADKDPPSPMRKDVVLAFRRFRIKSGMTIKGWIDNNS